MRSFLSSGIRVILFLSIVLISGCGADKKTTLGLDVDVYLHPSSSDPADILLQAGIDKRLGEDETTKNGIIHVRVVGGVVTLSGTAKSNAVKDKAQQIARETDVKLDGSSIWPAAARKINNQIEIQP
jgi:osmotically-inducible protein OsmY